MKSFFGGSVLKTPLVALLFLCGLPSVAHPQQAAPKPGPFKASAIQILQIQSEDVKLPAEFQTALYENVIEQVDKTKRFQHVYRDGDSNSGNAPDLVTLQCTVTGFKQGNAETRQVTTVAGATTIAVHMKFTGKDGMSLFETDAKGRVRFLGENLRATYDFGKKVGGVVRQDFIATSSAPK
jgi:hypothetical protein